MDLYNITQLFQPHQCHHTHHVQPDAHRFWRVFVDM